MKSIEEATQRSSRRSREQNQRSREQNGEEGGATKTRALTAAWLGRVDYPAGWSWQRELFLARLDGDVGDSLMLLEHPPTYTLGKRAMEQDLVFDERRRLARGISLYKVDRGGRATYHGPGQLVGYPILELGERYDVIAYLRKLEEVLIRTAADLGVEAARDEDHTGVWVGTNKIGAIGVKITRGITMHGFAFNVTTDLSMFEGIVPCGIQGRWVTSVKEETGVSRSVKEVASIAANHVSDVFGRSLVWAHPRTLFSAGPRPATGSEPAIAEGVAGKLFDDSDQLTHDCSKAPVQKPLPF